MKVIFPALAAAVLLEMGICSSPAQEKKSGKKDPPRVALAIPLGAAPGSTVTFTIRGKKLDQARALRFANPQVRARIARKGAAAVPDKNPEQVGDTQILAEVVLPRGLPGGPLSFMVETAAGTSKPHQLLIEAKLPLVSEKEPNDGFKEAQRVSVPQAIDGRIERPRDVDVFRFEGKAGQLLICEILAARHGSALDSLLTLYNSAGQQIAANDDVAGSVDSRLEATLPGTAAYYLTVMDAYDQGGPAHVYRLLLR